MKTKLTTTIDSEANETHFEGKVTLVGKTFSYSLDFQVPLSEYRNAGRGKTVAQMRQMIPIAISDNGRLISLENMEWEIFYHIIVPSILKIYNLRVLSEDSERTFSYEQFEERGDIYLKPTACRLLAQPKFGCQFLNQELDPPRKPS